MLFYLEQVMETVREFEIEKAKGRGLLGAVRRSSS